MKLEALKKELEDREKTLKDEFKIQVNEIVDKKLEQLMNMLTEGHRP
jgi:hypothetical protein